MRGYWLRIIAGALGIFVVGFAFISAVRAGKDRVHVVTETAEPISIPLAFVAFNLGDQRVGTIRRLTILRDAPDAISGFRIRVELSDPEALRALTPDCVMTVADPTQLSNRTNFLCVAADSTLVEFGRVELVPQTGGTRVDLPLFLTRAAAAEFGGKAGEGNAEVNVVVNTDSIARVVRRMADSLRNEARVLADSLRRGRVEAPVAPPPPSP